MYTDKVRHSNLRNGLSALAIGGWNLPWPIGATPLRVSDYHFPISVFYFLSLALALAPIGHGNTVVDRFPSPSPSPGTHRQRYLSATVRTTSRFRFPFPNFRFPTSRHFQPRRGPRGIYRLGGQPTVHSMSSCTYNYS